MIMRHIPAILLLAAVGVAGCHSNHSSKTSASSGGSVTLLNVSYSPTVQLYQSINKAFASEWKSQTGQTVTINMSHGGSGKEARAVINGLSADVVTLALASDIDAIADKAGLLPEDWQSRLPDDSSPYTSTIVFLVRKGNPKHIRDWDDLTGSGISVITPNPKTSGGARWNFLAAWGYELDKSGNNEKSTRDFVTRLYQNVPVLDSSARDAADTFVERGIGDVLITWENEALLAMKNFGPDKFQIVYPSESILTEPPVALVTKNAEQHGTSRVADAYLKFLYTKPAQTVIAQHFYRPRMSSVEADFRKQFPPVQMFTVDKIFGGWHKAQKKYFSDGGVFDQIYGKNH